MTTTVQRFIHELTDEEHRRLEADADAAAAARGQRWSDAQFMHRCCHEEAPGHTEAVAEMEALGRRINWRSNFFYAPPLDQAKVDGLRVELAKISRTDPRRTDLLAALTQEYESAFPQLARSGAIKIGGP